MNNIISVKQIARETLPRLIDNLVFPGRSRGILY